MKKKNDLVRKISSIVLGGFLAILLCAPNVRALTIPSGETMTIDYEVLTDEGWPDMLEIYGTAILEGDAQVPLGIYAFPGKELNEPGSTVHIYGCAPYNWFSVLETSNIYQGLDAVVNIYGSRFYISLTEPDEIQIDPGSSFAPPVDTPITGWLYVLNELEEVQFSIMIYSDINIHLRAPESEEPEQVEAELKTSPSLMSRNRRCPVVCAMIRLPEGIVKDDVEDNYPLMIYACENGVGVEAKYQRIFNPHLCKQDDPRVKIFAFFNIGTLLQDLPEDCEKMQLQVRGRLKAEKEFYGNDEIKIVQPRRKHWSYMKNWKSRKPYRHR